MRLPRRLRLLAKTFGRRDCRRQMTATPAIKFVAHHIRLIIFLFILLIGAGYIAYGIIKHYKKKTRIILLALCMIISALVICVFIILWYDEVSDFSSRIWSF